MADGFDVVAVRVEQEGGVIAGMIRPYPRPAIVAAAGGKSRLIHTVRGIGYVLRESPP